MSPSQHATADQPIRFLQPGNSLISLALTLSLGFTMSITHPKLKWDGSVGSEITMQSLQSLLLQCDIFSLRAQDSGPGIRRPPLLHLASTRNRTNQIHRLFCSCPFKIQRHTLPHHEVLRREITRLSNSLSSVAEFSKSHTSASTRSHPSAPSVAEAKPRNFPSTSPSVSGFR
jgi:hypothetical protein